MHKFALDTFNVIAAITTAVSVFFNILQWKRRRDLVKNFRADSQAMYNDFCRIDVWCNVEKFYGDETKFNDVVHRAHVARGISEAARSRIVAFGREYLKLIPVSEEPGAPYPGKLPKPGKPSET